MWLHCMGVSTEFMLLGPFPGAEMEKLLTLRWPPAHDDIEISHVILKP